MFRDNFGAKDLLLVNRIRKQNQPGSDLINYQKRTYEYLKNGAKLKHDETTDSSKCGVTMYRNSFLYNDSKLDPELRT